MKRKAQSNKLNLNTFNYSNYLRDYYNRMLAGEEKVPSNAELELFFRKLGKVSSKKLSTEKACPVEICDEEEELKLIA